MPGVDFIEYIAALFSRRRDRLMTGTSISSIWITFPFGVAHVELHSSNRGEDLDAKRRYPDANYIIRREKQVGAQESRGEPKFAKCAINLVHIFRRPCYPEVMPIFEYSCDDCGNKFEKLLRRVTEANDVRCPSCGQEHLTTQYSTFAAHAKAASQPQQDCGAGMCGSGACQSGMCGMNYN